MVFQAARNSRKRLVTAVALASAVMGPVSNLLADRTWDRGAGTNFWTDAANWNPDGLPTSADAAIFTDTGAGIVDVNLSDQPGSGSLLGLTFNNATTSYTIQNGGQIFANAITHNSGAAVINTISAQVNITNGITVNSGTLVLSNGNNTINGPNSIAAGAKLDVLAPGTNSIGNVTLNGGTLVVRGGVQTNLNQLQQFAYKGIFGQNRLNPISTGTGALAQTATSTDVLTGPLSFSDAQLNTIGGQNDAYTIVWKGNVTVASAGTYSFGTASDDGSVVYIDTNNDGLFDPTTELVLNSNFDQGTTQRTASTTLSAGTFGIAIGYYENGGGAAMEARILDGTQLTYGSQTVLDPTVGTANLSFSYTQNFDANLSGSNITVTAANSVIDIQSSFGTVGNVSFNAGTSLTVQGMFGGTATLGDLSGAGAATLNTSIATTAGTLSGFTVFTKGGTNTLTLGDSPSFNGQIVVAAGTLLATSTNVLGSTTGNTIVQSGGQVSLRTDGITEPIVLNGTGPSGSGALESGVDNNSHSFAGPISLGSDAFIVSSTGGKTLTLTGGVTTGGFQARFGGNGDIVINTGVIGGAGGIRKTEGGTLTINTTSTYTGTTQVDAGTLAFTAPLSGSSTINLTNGTINAGAAIKSGAALNVTGGTYNANAAGALNGNSTISSTGVIRVTTGVGAGGSINVNAGGELRFDAANTGLTTPTNNINVTGGGLVRSTSGGIADLSTQNLVVTPRIATNNANALRAVAINSTAFDPTTGTNVNNVLNLSPTVTSTLPNGSGAANNGAINFPQASGDGRYNSFFGTTLNDQMTAYFHGRFTAPTAGSYQFRVTDNDDTGTVALDMNDNQSFADGVDKLATIGCCNNDTNITVTLTAGQTIGVWYGMRDTGGGSGLVGHFTLPAGSDTLVTPGDPAQAGLWSFQTATGGGTVQVDSGSELRVRTITGASNVNLNSGTLTLTAGTVGSPLSSSSDNLTVSGGSTLNVGANHTVTVSNFSAVSSSLGVGSLTKTGAGTLTVTGGGTTTLNNGQIIANAGVMDLGQTRITSTARNTVNGIQGRLYVNTQINPINNAAGVMNLIGLNPTNTRVLDSSNGPNGGLDFKTDVDLANFFGNNNVSNDTGQPNNNYTVVFTGTYNAQITGTHTFGIGRNDDNTAVFLDLNRNGNFETNEQIVTHGCCNNNDTDFTSGTANLTAGQSYGYAIVTEDTGGGGETTGKFFDGGALTSATVIAPGATGQVNTWTLTTGGGALQVDPGATLVVGGTDAPLDATVSGTLRYSAQGSATSNTLTSLIVPTGQTGTLDIQTNQTLTITSGNSMALNGNLTKTGAGRLAINAATTGTGSVSVTGGTLGGTGSIAGPLSVSGPIGTGGTVAPGNSIGTFSSGNFTISSAGGTLGIELDPTNSGGLGTSDNLNVTGTVTLTGGNLALSLLSSPTVGQQFQIITNDSSDAVSGSFATANGNAIVGNSFTAFGDTFSINYASGTGNDVVLTVTAVPEPATVGTLGLAVLGLLARRRRRR